MYCTTPQFPVHFCAKFSEDNAEIRYLEYTLGIFEKECLKEFLGKEQVSEQEFLPKRLAFIHDRYMISH
jgi:hypothetical protein